MTRFARHATLLFVALRLGDLVNLLAALWLVPKFIAPESLGAVLPVTTFATTLALPVFAFAMAVMKESADLSASSCHGLLKSLWRGVFAAIGALTILSLILFHIFLPHYLNRMRVTDSSAGYCILAAALLGAVAPVYTDALQATKRFRALGLVELTAAAARFVALVILMPFRAFAGLFAGNALQPLVRIAASLFALRQELTVKAERWWTCSNTRRLCVRFLLILLYILIPMAVAGIEQDLIRTQLPANDSAAYYIVTRLTDLLNYLTFPLLLVLFPYAADASRKGDSVLALVVRCTGVTFAATLLLGGIYALWGASILKIFTHGVAYTPYLAWVPHLLAITALTAAQTFYTNAEVAAGHFGFLWWLVPMNFLYLLFLNGICDKHITACETTLPTLIYTLLAGAVLRFVCAAAAGTISAIRNRRRRS